MIKRKHIKIFLSAGALLVFTIHFLMTLTYLTPYDWNLGKLKSASRLYVGPFFHQNWKVFAPEPPTTSQHFLFRCQFEDGAWSLWTDPGIPILERHYSNRLSYHGKEYNIYESMARNLKTSYERIDHYMDEEVNRQEKLDSAMLEMPSYGMARKYAWDKKVALYGEGPLLKLAFKCRYDSIAPPGSESGPSKVFHFLALPMDAQQRSSL